MNPLHFQKSFLQSERSCITPCAVPLQRKTSLCWKQNKDLPQDLWRTLVSPTPSSSTTVTAPQFSGVRAKYRILQSTMTSSIKPETQEPLQKTVVKLHYSWAWKRFLTPHQKGWFGLAPLGGVCKAFLLSFTKKYISFWIFKAKPFTFLMFYSIPLPYPRFSARFQVVPWQAVNWIYWMLIQREIPMHTAYFSFRDTRTWSIWRRQRLSSLLTQLPQHHHSRSQETQETWNWSLYNFLKWRRPQDSTPNQRACSSSLKNAQKFMSI